MRRHVKSRGFIMEAGPKTDGEAPTEQSQTTFTGFYRAEKQCSSANFISPRSADERDLARRTSPTSEDDSGLVFILATAMDPLHRKIVGLGDGDAFGRAETCHGGGLSDGRHTDPCGLGAGMIPQFRASWPFNTLRRSIARCDDAGRRLGGPR